MVDYHKKNKKKKKYIKVKQISPQNKPIQKQNNYFNLIKKRNKILF